MTAALLIIVNTASAYFISYADPCSWTGSFDIGGGYRQDHFNWDTHLPFLPQTKIQEQWNNISIGVIEANGQFYYEDAFILADFDYGWAVSGNHRFKHIDMPTKQVIQSLSSKTKGDIWDISGGIGYQFHFCKRRYIFAPMLGYCYHQQEFKNRRFHNNLIDTPVIGNSRFSYCFNGPWVGIVAGFNWDCHWQFYVDYRFHWIRFQAKINQDVGIVVRDHRTKSHLENEATLGVNYTYCNAWWTGLKLIYKNLNTTKKHGHPNTSDGRTKLANLRWESWALTLDVGYAY